MFLLEKDALNGKEGTGFLTINGEIHEMFSMKNFQTDAEFQESDFKVVGSRMVQKKTTGVSLTGKMTIYYGTPYFIMLLIEYLKAGKLPYREHTIPRHGKKRPYERNPGIYQAVNKTRTWIRQRGEKRRPQGSLFQSGVYLVKFLQHILLFGKCLHHFLVFNHFINQ